MQEQGCHALLNLANSRTQIERIKTAGAIPAAKAAQRAHGGTKAAKAAIELLSILG